MKMKWIEFCSLAFFNCFTLSLCAYLNTLLLFLNHFFSGKSNKTERFYAALCHEQQLICWHNWYFWELQTVTESHFMYINNLPNISAECAFSFKQYFVWISKSVVKPNMLPSQRINLLNIGIANISRCRNIDFAFHLTLFLSQQ